MSKKKSATKTTTTRQKKTSKKKPSGSGRPSANYPRQSSNNALRIPQAILDQNAGRDCTDLQAAQFLGLSTAKGPFAVEISSGIKYGFLSRPSSGKLAITDLARQIVKPKSPDDITDGHQKAVLNAPTISDAYLHYRGENLPDRQFFNNAIEDEFNVPKDKVLEFKAIFTQCLEAANLIQEHDGRIRVLHSASTANTEQKQDERIQKISEGVSHIPQVLGR